MLVGAFGSVWATGIAGVIRIDPASHKVLARIPIQGGAGWTAASDDAVWVTTATGVARIDPATNAVATTIALAERRRSAIPTSSRSGLGAADPQEPIAIIDPATNTVSRTSRRRRPVRGHEIAGEAWVPSWKGKRHLAGTSRDGASGGSC